MAITYTTLAEIKTFCQVSGSGDDTLLTALGEAAEKWIEKKTGRVFYIAAASDQTYSRVGEMRNRRFSGNKLYFYSELATSDGVTITDSPTVTYLPEDGPPYYGCIKTDGSWAYPTVTINGKWGYSETAPSDIELAIWKITKWMYDMQDTSGNDLVVTPEGQVLIPQGIPADIMALIEPYIKVKIA